MVRDQIPLLFLGFWFAGNLGCQPASEPLALEVEAGDLVLIALGTFPAVATPSTPSVSLYQIEAGEPLRWTFIESRNPSADRLSSVSNDLGALVISTSTRAAELIVWRAPLAKLKYDPITYDGLIRLREDASPGLGYRCFEHKPGCNWSDPRYIGPVRGKACLLSEFGTAYHYQRSEDGWIQLQPPNLQNYALEIRDVDRPDCEDKYSPWDNQ